MSGETAHLLEVERISWNLETNAAVLHVRSTSEATQVEGALIEKVNPGEIECVKQIRSQDNPGFSDESLRELADDILVGQILPRDT